MKKVNTLFLALTIAISGLSSYLDLDSKNFNLNNVQAQQVEFDRLIDNEIASETSGNQNEETIFLTDNYASYYYKNLTENFGNNTKGSCGYVAIGMLLSYWDTFWDDNMIPENYDMITMLETNSINTSLESPGIYREPFSLVGNVTNDQYYQIIEQYSNVYFQLKLIQMGKEQFGQYVFDTSSSPTGMTYDEYLELLDYYLYTYRNYTEDQVEIRAYNGSAQNVRAQAINLIKQGIPVKLGIGGTNGGHAVVAYDYDEINDEIYVHAGWNENFTHVTLSEIGYSQYWNAIAIVFKDTVNHSCSNNFKYSNEYETLETHCVCDLSIHPTRYSITYENLDFQGMTATFFVDDLYVANPPSSYAWVSGLGLSNITARMSSGAPYSPQMVFIGWCSDAALTQPITNIPQYSVGDLTLYAKWRYDYNAVTATRTYFMIADNQKFTHYDTATIGMNVEGLYENLTAIGIEYLAVRINISIQALNSSQKKIYFYGDSTQSSYLGEIAFNYQGAGVYTTTAYLPIETIEDVGILYLRYGGSGGFATWGTDQIFLEIMYVAAQEDVAAAPFTWDYQNPFL